MTYTIVLRQNEEGTWLVNVPALIGCHTFGGTREQAILNAREAIKGCIESLRATGDPVPIEEPAVETVIVSVS